VGSRAKLGIIIQPKAWGLVFHQVWERTSDSDLLIRVQRTVCAALPRAYDFGHFDNDPQQVALSIIKQQRILRAT
jgi:hypothetical protein